MSATGWSTACVASAWSARRTDGTRCGRRWLTPACWCSASSTLVLPPVVTLWLLAADDRQGFRRHQFPDRADHRDPLCGRRGLGVRLAPYLRPDARAEMEHRARVSGRCRWAGGVDLFPRSGAKDDRPFDLCDRSARD